MKIRDGPVSLEINGVGENEGYERWRDYHGGEQFVVYVHQLTAIAEGANPYDVFSNGQFEVHHVELEWAGGKPVYDFNAGDYLKVIDHGEHYRTHVSK